MADLALSGLVIDGIGTQGVALGWHRVAPSGRQSTSARGAGCQSAGVRVMGRQSTGAGGAVSCASGKFKYGKSFKASATGAGSSRLLFTPRPVRRPATFIAFAHQQISRFATVPFFPFARLVLACVAFVASTITASACGISWSLPATPMDSEHRFQYWEKLGQIVVGGTSLSNATKIPLHLGFNPLATFPSLLGVGWSLPIFESRVEWRGADTAELFLPDGQTTVLKRTRDSKQRLKGSGWIAEISGRQMTCKASCGWVLVFLDNRLKTMKTPDGDTLGITENADGARRLLSGTNTLVTLKLDFDPKTTLKFFRLVFADRSLLLHIGKRPILRQDSKPHKMEYPESLVEIENSSKNISTEKFKFKQNELFTRGHLYKWNPKTGFLTMVDQDEYSCVSIRGVQCLQQKKPDGTITLRGSKGFVSVEQVPGGMIQITESIRNPNPEGLPLMLPRRIYTFKNGREELIQQHLYDDSNKEIGLYSKRNGREIIYSYGKNSIEAKDAKTKEILWTKTFDDQGNILKFKNAAASYIFQKKEGSYYHIKRISANGVEEKSVSEALFKHFCENL